MTDIIGGLVLIGVGFAMGSSVFMGDFTTLNLIFDTLGILWIGRGVYRLCTQRRTPS